MLTTAQLCQFTKSGKKPELRLQKLVTLLQDQVVSNVAKERRK